MLPLDTSTSQCLTLTHELILGLDLSVPPPNRNYRELPVATGRFLRPGDRRAVGVGAPLASARSLPPGGGPSPAGRPYTVLGALQPTLTAPPRLSALFRPGDPARPLAQHPDH